MTTLVRGGTVLDTSGERAADVLLHDGRIRAVAEPGTLEAPTGHEVVDASGCLVMPGLVDIQVHFREPGKVEAEDIVSGATGAARGGMTAVVMMPNTTPAIDDVEMVRDVLARAADAVVEVRTSAALTRGREGRELVDMAALHAAGVRVFTDDGDSLMDTALMREALLATTRLPGAVVSQHCEDAALVAGGAINEGPVAERLGVAGRPALAEEVVVARDIALARATGGRYHVLHLSSAASLAHVVAAKREGLAVTCEVTPQHLVLTHDDVERLGSDGKMNPPLRTAADVAALRRGLAADQVDAVATDHAPHAPTEKARGLDAAPPGMLGTETALSVIWTHLVEPGLLDRRQVVAAMSARPARIAGLEGQGHPVAPGAPANLCVFDPSETWTVDPEALASKSRNSPFRGQVLTGRVRYTLWNGRTTFTLG